MRTTERGIDLQADHLPQSPGRSQQSCGSFRSPFGNSQARQSVERHGNDATVPQLAEPVESLNEQGFCLPDVAALARGIPQANEGDSHPPPVIDRSLLGECRLGMGQGSGSVSLGVGDGAETTVRDSRTKRFQRSIVQFTSRSQRILQQAHGLVELSLMDGHHAETDVARRHSLRVAFGVGDDQAFVKAGLGPCDVILGQCHQSEPV